MSFTQKPVPEDLSILERHLTSSSSSFEAAAFCVQHYRKTPAENRPGVVIYLNYLCAKLAGQAVAQETVAPAALWALHHDATATATAAAAGYQYQYDNDDPGQPQQPTSRRAALEKCFKKIARQVEVGVGGRSRGGAALHCSHRSRSTSLNLPAAIGARVAIDIIEDALSPLHRLSRFWDVLANADTTIPQY